MKKTNTLLGIDLYKEYLLVTFKTEGVLYKLQEDGTFDQVHYFDSQDKNFAIKICNDDTILTL